MKEAPGNTPAAPSTSPNAESQTEPWMRGTHPDLDVLQRGVVHALELAGEDIDRWCAGLSSDELHLRPFGLVSVAFHLRHIARSLDRLLTYAEDRALSDAQLAALRTEMTPGEPAAAVLLALRTGLGDALLRVQAFAPASFAAPRGIGRKRLPTTVAGLLIHCAEHTQRHTGQAITTAGVVTALRSATQTQPPSIT